MPKNSIQNPKDVGNTFDSVFLNITGKSFSDFVDDAFPEDDESEMAEQIRGLRDMLDDGVTWEAAEQMKEILDGMDDFIGENEGELADEQNQLLSALSNTAVNIEEIQDAFDLMEEPEKEEEPDDDDDDDDKEEKEEDKEEEIENEEVVTTTADNKNNDEEDDDDDELEEEETEKKQDEVETEIKKDTVEEPRGDEDELEDEDDLEEEKEQEGVKEEEEEIPETGYDKHGVFHGSEKEQGAEFLNIYRAVHPGSDSLEEDLQTYFSDPDNKFFNQLKEFEKEVRTNGTTERASDLSGDILDQVDAFIADNKSELAGVQNSILIALQESFQKTADLQFNDNGKTIDAKIAFENDFAKEFGSDQNFVRALEETLSSKADRESEFYQKGMAFADSLRCNGMDEKTVEAFDEFADIAADFVSSVREEDAGREYSSGSTAKNKEREETYRAENEKKAVFFASVLRAAEKNDLLKDLESTKKFGKISEIEQEARNIEENDIREQKAAQEKEQTKQQEKGQTSEKQDSEKQQDDRESAILHSRAELFGASFETCFGADFATALNRAFPADSRETDSIYNLASAFGETIREKGVTRDAIEQFVSLRNAMIDYRHQKDGTTPIKNRFCDSFLRAAQTVPGLYTPGLEKWNQDVAKYQLNRSSKAAANAFGTLYRNATGNHIAEDFTRCFDTDSEMKTMVGDFLEEGGNIGITPKAIELYGKIHDAYGEYVQNAGKTPEDLARVEFVKNLIGTGNKMPELNPSLKKQMTSKLDAFNRTWYRHPSSLWSNAKPGARRFENIYRSYLPGLDMNKDIQTLLKDRQTSPELFGHLSAFSEEFQKNGMSKKAMESFRRFADLSFDFIDKSENREQNIIVARLIDAADRLPPLKSYIASKGKPEPYHMPGPAPKNERLAAVEAILSSGWTDKEKQKYGPNKVSPMDGRRILTDMYAKDHPDTDFYDRMEETLAGMDPEQPLTGKFREFSEELSKNGMTPKAVESLFQLRGGVNEFVANNKGEHAAEQNQFLTDLVRTGMRNPSVRATAVSTDRTSAFETFDPKERKQDFLRAYSKVSNGQSLTTSIHNAFDHTLVGLQMRSAAIAFTKELRENGMTEKATAAYGKFCKQAIEMFRKDLGTPEQKEVVSNLVLAGRDFIELQDARIRETAPELAAIKKQIIENRTREANARQQREKEQRLQEQKRREELQREQQQKREKQTESPHQDKIPRQIKQPENAAEAVEFRDRKAFTKAFSDLSDKKSVYKEFNRIFQSAADTDMKSELNLFLNQMGESGVDVLAWVHFDEIRNLEYSFRRDNSGPQAAEQNQFIHNLIQAGKGIKELEPIPYGEHTKDEQFDKALDDYAREYREFNSHNFFWKRRHTTEKAALDAKKNAMLEDGVSKEEIKLRELGDKVSQKDLKDMMSKVGSIDQRTAHALREAFGKIKTGDKKFDAFRKETLDQLPDAQQYQEPEKEQQKEATENKGPEKEQVQPEEQKVEEKEVNREPLFSEADIVKHFGQEGLKKLMENREKNPEKVEEKAGPEQQTEQIGSQTV